MQHESQRAQMNGLGEWIECKEKTQTCTVMKYPRREKELTFGVMTEDNIDGKALRGVKMSPNPE